MAKYYRLKDRQSSRGLAVGGILFNNATVAKYDNVPNDVRTAARQGILEECKAIDYTNYQKALDKATVDGKAKREARRMQFVRRVASKTGETEEEVVKKTTKKKKPTKKEQEVLKEDSPKEEAPKEEAPKKVGKK